MVRKLILSFAVIGVSFGAGACDSDVIKIGEKNDGGFDSGLVLDAGIDAGPQGPLVLNAGAACGGDSDCDGAAPMCQTTQDIPAGPMGQGGGGTISFPDGYCTATCTSQEQCGAGSECGVKKLIEALSPFLMGMGIPAGALDQVPSQCLDLCSNRNDCREGYVCQNLLEATGQASALPAGAGFLFSKYCLPSQAPVGGDASVPAVDASSPEMDASQPSPDAGMSLDAGISQPDAAQHDSGPGDAAVGDASTSDAGPRDAG